MFLRNLQPREIPSLSGRPVKRLAPLISPFFAPQGSNAMANYATNTTHRPPPAASSPPPSAATQPDDPKASSTRRNNLNNVMLMTPFSLPRTPEAAAVRILRNLSYFGLSYVLFIWVILFVVLLPAREVSLIFLVVMTAVTGVYLLLLRLLPNSVVLHKVIDKWLVFALIFILTAIEMVLTEAEVHFFVTLAAATPVVFVHALLRVIDDRFVSEENCAAGELVPLVGERASDLESSSPV